MKSIGCGTIPGQFSQDFSTASFGMTLALNNQDASTLPHHQAVTMAVKGFWNIFCAARHSSQTVKSSHP